MDDAEATHILDDVQECLKVIDAACKNKRLGAGQYRLVELGIQLEDLEQEVLIKVWKHFKGTTKNELFVFAARVARNLCANKYKDPRRTLLVSLTEYLSIIEEPDAESDCSNNSPAALAAEPPLACTELTSAVRSLYPSNCVIFLLSNLRTVYEDKELWDLLIDRASRVLSMDPREMEHQLRQALGYVQTKGKKEGGLTTKAILKLFQNLPPSVSACDKARFDARSKLRRLMTKEESSP